MIIGLEYIRKILIYYSDLKISLIYINLSIFIIYENVLFILILLIRILNHNLKNNISTKYFSLKMGGFSLEKQKFS